MTNPPFLVDRSSWDDAASLIDRFGTDAGSQAAARAHHSRDVGNIRHFCRWRQIERLIAHLASDAAPVSLH